MKRTKMGMGAFLIAGSLFLYPSTSVLFESEESRTREDKPVFNEIRYFSYPEKDVWMMNQSHHGLEAKPEQWDRLAIVVDKTQSPKRARFYQFTSVPLEWSVGLERKEFRVSCFMCHSNGPRAIRPVSLHSQAQVLLWNLRIKSYGRVLFDEAHDREDRDLKVPFRSHARIDNDKLKVATCVGCHKESGFLARGSLTRQHAITIQHRVKSGHMPPLGFRLSSQESAQLNDFIEGF